jgi:iron uptake system component EfeO
MRTIRLLTLATASAGLVVGLAACSKGGAPGAAGAGGEVAVAASDTACALSRSELSAGVYTFTITNNGAKITEFYVFHGAKTVGEVENIGPGTSRSVSVELIAGSYQGVCKPGMVGEGIKQAFTVTGTATPLSEDEKLANAVNNYKQYVRSQVDLFVPKVKEFTDAIRANDAAKAKTLFPMARSYYEAIEPVAESFGDLDPAIDAREGNTEPGVEWTGFHVLEQHLWVAADIRKDAALADKLDADVQKLAERVKTVEFKPLEIANGAKELLDEVATKKITGEEDRYSHTDLWDFAANLEGSQAAVSALRPVLDERAPGLAKTLDEKFTTAKDTLGKHRAGDGWKLHTELSKADLKELSDAVNALAEPISKVAAVVAQ